MAATGRERGLGELGGNRSVTVHPWSITYIMCRYYHPLPCGFIGPRNMTILVPTIRRGCIKLNMILLVFRNLR